MKRKSLLKCFKSYLMAILMSDRIRSICEMSTLFEDVSHDALTRFIQLPTSSEKMLLKVGEKFYRLGDGYLIIDDTVIQKPHQKNFEGFTYVYDHTSGRKVKGICVVFIAWTNGKIVIPLYSLIYQKDEQTRIELALALLSKVRNSLKIKPKAVLFDSWYSCVAIMKRIQSYGWQFVTQIKKNRIVDGKSISNICFAPYQSYCGKLKCGIKLSIFRNRKKYYVTNRINVSRKEILEIYIIRQMIEQLFKDLKSNFSLTDISVRSKIGWKNHINMCCIAFIIATLMGEQLGLKPSKIKRKFISREIPVGEDVLNSFIAFA